MDERFNQVILADTTPCHQVANGFGAPSGSGNVAFQQEAFEICWVRVEPEQEYLLPPRDDQGPRPFVASTVAGPTIGP